MLLKGRLVILGLLWVIKITRQQYILPNQLLVRSCNPTKEVFGEWWFLTTHFSNLTSMDSSKYYSLVYTFYFTILDSLSYPHFRILCTNVWDLSHRQSIEKLDYSRLYWLLFGFCANKKRNPQSFQLLIERFVVGRSGWYIDRLPYLKENYRKLVYDSKWKETLFY